MIYVGIDNGLNGALVAISDRHSLIIDKLVMPTTGKQSGNEVDALAVLQWFRRISAGDPGKALTVILETPGKFSPGVMSLTSMWDSYGALRSLLACARIRHHRKPPQSWQKVMLPGCAKGDTKPAALAKARQLWPGEDWLATPRCKKPHDGLVDAALIAEYGRVGRL